VFEHWNALIDEKLLRRDGFVSWRIVLLQNL
jgi:hypothetical protein